MISTVRAVDIMKTVFSVVFTASPCTRQYDGVPPFAPPKKCTNSKKTFHINVIHYHRNVSCIIFLGAFSIISLSVSSLPAVFFIFLTVFHLFVLYCLLATAFILVFKISENMNWCS